MAKIGLIGCGAWGDNLARNLVQLEALFAVADRNAKAANEFASAFNVSAMSSGGTDRTHNISMALSLPLGLPVMMSLPLQDLPLPNTFTSKTPLSLSLAGAHAIRDAAKSLQNDGLWLDI